MKHHYRKENRQQTDGFFSTWQNGEGDELVWYRVMLFQQDARSHLSPGEQWNFVK